MVGDAALPTPARQTTAKGEEAGPAGVRSGGRERLGGGR